MSSSVDTQTPQPRQMTFQDNGSATGESGDDALVTMAQGGDEHAFRTLVERHKERVRNMIHNILHDRDAIDDIAQDVFIKVYTGLPMFRFDAAFTTWLYRITVNKCRDELRKRRVRRFLSLNMLMENNDRELHDRLSQAPAEPGMDREIRAALAGVPDLYRIPVVLRDIDGLSNEEISALIDAPAGTVKSRIARGRALLRSMLEPVLKCPAAAPVAESAAQEDRTP